MVTAKKILSLLLLVAATGARASVDDRGFVVVCQKATTARETYEALPLYEARVSMHGVTMDLGGPELSVGRKVALVLSRLKLDPERRARYAAWLNRWEKRLYLTDDPAYLADVPLKDVPMEPGCRVKFGMSAERWQTTHERNKIWVARPYWNALDADGKAALLVHQAVASEVHTPEHIRYFSEALFARDYVDTMPPEKYIELLRTCEIREYKYGVFPFYVGYMKFVFDPSGWIDLFEVGEPMAFDLGLQWRVFVRKDVVFHPGTMVPKRITINGDSYGTKKTESHAFLGGTDCRPTNDLEFHPNGAVAHVQFHRCSVNPVFNAGPERIKGRGTYASAAFYPNGSLACLSSLSHGQQLKTKEGKKYFWEEKPMTFDVDGNAAYETKENPCSI